MYHSEKIFVCAINSKPQKIGLLAPCVGSPEVPASVVEWVKACLSETMQLGLSTLCSNQGVGLKKSLTGHYNTASCVIHENDLKWNRGQHSHCYCVLSSM